MQDAPLARLWYYARPYRLRIATASLWSFLNKAADIAPPFRNADRIYVVSDGTILESGTHGELVDHPGIYRSLWAVQTGSAVGN